MLPFWINNFLLYLTRYNPGSSEIYAIVYAMPMESIIYVLQRWEISLYLKPSYLATTQKIRWLDDTRFGNDEELGYDLTSVTIEWWCCPRPYRVLLNKQHCTELTGLSLSCDLPAMSVTEGTPNGTNSNFMSLVTRFYFECL